MSLHVFIFQLIVCLFLSLTLLWRLHWFPVRPSSSSGGAKRSRLHRLLKPRTPLDCPACCHSSPISTGASPSSLPVRPWGEVKSRRGAPKRIPTEGFACPNQQCLYFGITEAHIHASFRRWQTWPGRAHPDVSLPSLSHHVQRSAPYSPVPPENSLSPGCCGAVGTG